MPADHQHDPADGTWGGVNFVAVKTLVAHQRRDIGSCLCGWGVDTGDLGRNHSLHVWRQLQRALTAAGWRPPCAICFGPPHLVCDCPPLVIGDADEH